MDHDQIHGQLMALKTLLLAVIEKSQRSEEWYAEMAFHLAAMEKEMLSKGIPSPAFNRGFQEECRDLVQELGHQQRRLFP